VKLKFDFYVPTDRPGIVPNAYGVAFLILVFAIFAAGIYRRGHFAGISITLMVLGLVAMIQTNSTLDNVSGEVIDCEPGEEGGIGRVTLVLKNRGELPRYNLYVQPLKEHRAGPALFVPELRYHTTLELKIALKGRGIERLERIRIHSQGFYGLFFSWKWLRTDAEIVAYPRPQGHAPLPLYDMATTRRTRLNDDFMGHLQYHRGASLRAVDWKAFARGRPMMIKDFGSAELGPVRLAFSAAPGIDAETRLRQLSAWVFACIAERRSYSLELPGRNLPEGSGRAHSKAALRLLAAYIEDRA